MTIHPSDMPAIASDHLDQAKEAVALGDWPGAEFHIARAHQVLALDERTARRSYDVSVAWSEAGRSRRQLVRVTAATRALAHDAAQDWARTNIEGLADRLVLSTIEET